MSAILARIRPPLAYAGPRSGTRVALSFDDGPSEWTPSLLDVLAAERVHATFFLLGEALAGREETARRIVAEGHDVGNHTFSHPDPATLGDDALRAELERASSAIALAAGVTPRLARPPYLSDARRFARVAASVGLRPTVLATVDPADWRDGDSRRIAEHVLARVRPGDVVDLHDGAPAAAAGPTSRAATVEAVRLLIPGLRRRGLEPVSVSELLS